MFYSPTSPQCSFLCLFVCNSTVFSPFDFIPFPLCCLICLCECVPAHPNPSQGRWAGGRSCRPRPLHVADWYTCFPITHQRTWRESGFPATTLQIVQSLCFEIMLRFFFFSFLLLVQPFGLISVHFTSARSSTWFVWLLLRPLPHCSAFGFNLLQPNSRQVLNS